MSLLAYVVFLQKPTLTAERVGQPHGWMRYGYGKYRFVLQNDGPTTATVVRWTAHWEANGRSVGGPWGGDLDLPLTSHNTLVRDEIGQLPASVVDAAKPKPPEMVGSFTVRTGDGETALPFRFRVPEAILPEPLKTVKGKRVALALMASRYATFKTAHRTLDWLDRCYAAMIDLTGEHPYGGAPMTYQESPEHPYWAYSGRSMILNTDFVPSTLKDFDAGILSFGWVHEVGHNFDESIGPWYIWSDPCAEFQANFKLDYAVTHDPAAPYRIRWRTGSPAYGQSKEAKPLAPREMIDGFYGTFGDAYLADPKRTWDSMSSDEIHTLFQRLVYAYGWEPFRRWYRTYRRLANAGMKPPLTPEDKLSLAVAILSRETGTDLVLVFRLWRFPTTPESVERMKGRYRL